MLHVVAGIYLLIEWAAAWGKDERGFLWAAFMTLVITNLVAFRTATTNYVMLVPVLLLVFRIWEQRWKAAGTGLILASLAGLSVGLWLLFLGTVEGTIESPLMYLPLPFFCLISLWWVRWWALRPARLPLEDFSARLG